jgi:hypothetical protein
VTHRPPSRRDLALTMIGVVLGACRLMNAGARDSAISDVGAMPMPDRVMFAALLSVDPSGVFSEILIDPPYATPEAAWGNVLHTAVSRRPPHAPENARIDECLPFLVQRDGRLLRSGAASVEEGHKGLMVRSKAEWTLVRQWGGSEPHAQLFERNDRAETVLYLRKLAYWPFWHLEDKKNEAAASARLGERRLRMAYDAQGLGIMRLSIVCPEHNIDVFRVDVPLFEGGGEAAWQLIERVGMIIAERMSYDFLTDSRRLIGTCPEGEHPVVVLCRRTFR